MDHFVVSARKYRPATFNSVVGQTAITSTLKNAIKSKHLAQAFLFCGPRGVGKTTCARILAKTINCQNLGPDTEGCNECESCISFNNGQSLNIFELDAASNNSVDDIRALVDQVRYAPQSGNYKIYIIDEVHMLSTNAFNAFLKTLEEPPPYAIFILATTEKHKIIPTILSRCQIFDFNRITIDDIASHLLWISEQEKVKAEPEALHLIAQKADGALRDALSIFDQIVSFAGNEVTYKQVIDNLNILDYEYYFKITDCILRGDFSNALLQLNEIIQDGFDIHHFITGLTSHFRDVMVCKDPQTIALLEVSEKTKAKYSAQSQQCSAGLLFKLLETGNRCDVEYKASQNQRLHVEIAILKMCSFHVNTFNTSSASSNVSEKKSLNVETNSTFSNENSQIKLSETPNKNTEPVSNPVTISTLSKENTEKLLEVITETVIVSKNTDQKPAARIRATKGTISIAQKLQANKTTVENIAVVQEEIVTNKPVQEQELVLAVKQLADKLHSEGRRQLAAALNKHQPLLHDQLHVEIRVDNPIQADDILENKKELLTYLKEKLSNSSIEINARVTESNELPGTAYTPAEKFSKMVEKNPDLNHLREQFDLELDF